MRLLYAVTAHTRYLVVFLSQRDYEGHYTSLPQGELWGFLWEFWASLCHYDVVSSYVSRVIECISFILLYRYCMRTFLKYAHGFFMLSTGVCIYIYIYIYMSVNVNMNVYIYAYSTAFPRYDLIGHILWDCPADVGAMIFVCLPHSQWCGLGDMDNLFA